ncbi:Flp family type IVb pilin [Vibrio sp. HA2012]|uniref:Flp family type IVb pilin n=1 Tax=Vibrio sp. HA2012 TaxID=1971595 RepID=UPI000C2B5CB4|nr:Flp family type IVb pilin [Vibrio sp. HA2012]PJC86101.1 Flp family type IVb pilin [Vibrio sp. HA2012]
MLLSTYVKAKIALENFKKDQRGVTAIEYAIIGVAIAGIVGVAFSSDGDLYKNLSQAFTTIAGKLPSAS